MKYLLTSAGIHNALVDLLGKPIAECSVLCIPTATYAFPGGAAGAVLAQLRRWFGSIAYAPQPEPPDLAPPLNVEGVPGSKL